MQTNRRRWGVHLATLTATIAVASLFASAAWGAAKLKISSAATADSPWGHGFRLWKKLVETKTSGGVTFDFYYSGTQGSEVTVVDKMKAGQLDGAALSATGLSRIDKRLQLMQLPGAIRSWKTLDAVRKDVGGDFEKMLTDKKFSLVGWGDIGLVHFMSKGFEVRTPDDLKGKSPWIYGEDPISKALYARVGGVNPFVADLVAVLPNIENGKINCISAPPIAAEMLQWSSKFDHGVDAVNAIAVGGVVITNDSLDKLPADAKTAVLDAAKEMSASTAGLRQRLRNEDAASWERFKARTGVSIFRPTEADTAKWKPIFVDSVNALKKGVFEASLVDKVANVALANP